MEKQEKQIYKALTSIISEVSAIGKNQKNHQQGFMFRGIDDVMNELHTLFGKYKIVIVPEVERYEVKEHTTAKGTLMYTTHTVVKFHFVAEDGSEVVTTNVGEAMDTADKGMNKTMSCALKYALMQMFLIPTKDIEDADRVTPPETIEIVVKKMTQPLQPPTNNAMKFFYDKLQAANTADEVAAVWIEAGESKDMAQYMRERCNILGISDDTMLEAIKTKKSK